MTVASDTGNGSGVPDGLAMGEGSTDTVADEPVVASTIGDARVVGGAKLLHPATTAPISTAKIPKTAFTCRLVFDDWVMATHLLTRTERPSMTGIGTYPAEARALQFGLPINPAFVVC